MTQKKHELFLSNIIKRKNKSQGDPPQWTQIKRTQDPKPTIKQKNQETTAKMEMMVQIRKQNSKVKAIEMWKEVK